ncbi:hypothetical protein CPAR01_12579 [Colletotrichum paranaense]|uniref:Uncharacterized protein n=1 Tax=Colletotrichum paranaense TaxID=1914294 RepID=A0ABQ9S6U1_9PEZI|nr:uncharacterized protein CPAR01_12579 [Colletotrichum paranaense]KAK1528021.1 hypothetical protein CPAR01_12579 [Colletotrichum paranaense]
MGVCSQPCSQTKNYSCIVESGRLVHLEAVPSSLVQHRSNGTAPVQAT